jgi:hypothetical protein
MQEKTKIEYLDHSMTEDSNSVEILFCQELEKTGKINPLGEEMMKILITLVTRKDLIDEIYDELKKRTALVAILEDRLSTMNRELDKGAALFVGLACETPGDSVMYAYYLAHKMKQRNLGKTLDLETICMEIFPNGLFSKESLDEIWDKQKVSRGEGVSGSDNLLDYRKASESLIYE